RHTQRRRSSKQKSLAPPDLHPLRYLQTGALPIFSLHDRQRGSGLAAAFLSATRPRWFVAGNSERRRTPMTDNTNNETNGSKPSHYVYQVLDQKDGKSFWRRIGSAWSQKGDGLKVQLECLPLVGRLILRPITESQP